MGRSFFTPVKEPVFGLDRDTFYKPDNKAIEQILDAGDDVLPNTLVLMKNPMYATALQDFTRHLRDNSPDYSGVPDDELFESVSSDRDLNNSFWRFVDASEKYQKLSKHANKS